MTDEKTIIDSMVQGYYANLQSYIKMRDYYNGEHDIVATYKRETNRNNYISINNFIQKFIDEEIQYTLGNAVSFTSMSGNNEIINAIDNSLFHFKANHNQLLMKELEIYGTCYELSYIDRKGRYCTRILNPTNAIIYTDEDEVPQIFIHFYKRQYDDNQYKDIYYNDGRIEIYKNDALINTKQHIFKGCPVSICQMDIEQTIYCKIKRLNDAYNQIVSDQVNVIADYRNAYLVVVGAEVDEVAANTLKEKGILNLTSKDSTVSWLLKEMNDQYIQNMIGNLKNSMYENCNHIDGNEKLQSNTSSLAIRSRLIFLENRCKTMFDIVSDTIYDRLERLFEYLSLKNLTYNVKDIRISYTPNIPIDIITIVQAISQLGDKISLETALKQLPWVENPSQEIEKIKAEKSAMDKIDLDKINGYGE
ncbi:MAG: phage portal protein family [Anaerocolumna sp.]|jgi:SPP1 family phage portal protein|nr:phage portal protein family [Anaerocolumna sp.]